MVAPQADPWGVNVAPGSADDGWSPPDPVDLPCGSRVTLFKDGEALDAAFRAIRAARSRVCLEVYIVGDDPVAAAFVELLVERARDGVSVHVIFDSFGSFGPQRRLIRRLRRGGVHVEEFHPVLPWKCRFSWRPFNRDHRKLLIVDDRIAGLGGLNLAREYAGPWVVRPDAGPVDAWRDTAIGVVGPAARHFLHAFARTWNYLHRGGRIVRAELLHEVEPGAASPIGVLASVPTMSSPLRPLLARLLRGARSRLDLTVCYFAPDPVLVNALCDAARRGVRVRLMLPSRLDHALVIHAGRAFYHTLLAAGVEIYERGGVVLHAKTLVVDDRVGIVGSTNLDVRSIEYNLELSAIVRDAGFARQLRALFDHDVRFATRVDAETWRRRPTRDRFLQWAVSRARYVF